MKSTKKIISLALVVVLLFGVVITTPISVNAASNEEEIYNYCISSLGLNTAAACGVLANIEKESSFNPTASCIDTNGLTSYGICQWNGGRFTNLKNFCSQQKRLSYALFALPVWLISIN